MLQTKKTKFVGVGMIVAAIGLLAFQNCQPTKFEASSTENASQSVGDPPVMPPPVTSSNCTFNGQTVLNGNGVTAYQASQVANGSQCVSQPRICQNGVLSGTYAHSSCDVQAPTVSCPQQTATVPTSKPGVTCTDTLRAYTGPAGVETAAYREGRTTSLGSACNLPQRDSTYTVYFGTVAGAEYGTCQNWCAVIATCTASGWTNFRFTW